MVDVAFLPCSIVKKVESAEIVKSGPVTTTGTFTEWESMPLVAVTVT